MKNLSLLVLSLLFYSAFSATLKAQEASQALFFGEHFQIPLTAGGADVSFRSSIAPGREKPLMRSGKVVDPRAKLGNDSNILILENVGESDEGVYTITSNQNTDDVKRITLYVRDCSREVMAFYGSDFHITFSEVSDTLRVGFRHSSVEANQTSLPAVELFNADGTLKEKYQDRIEITPQKFILHAVTGADEGSYTFSEPNRKVKMKICLKVQAHHKFERVSYGGTLKIDLHMNGSLARLFYTPKSDISKYKELNLHHTQEFEGRLSLEDSVCLLRDVKDSDEGRFSVIDHQGFLVSNVTLEMIPYMIPKLYIAIIALVALLVLLLLICLVSCLVKIRKRAAKARAIEEKVQNAGKVEGDAFRQVVKDACSQQNEEAPALSQKEDITEKSQSTEVSIKGLEVSTKEPSLQERNMETSDSGVGFNTSGLPLDSDTDVPTAAIADSDVLSSSAAPDVKSVPNKIPEPKAAPSPPKPAPASDLKPATVTKPTAPPPPSPEPKPPVTPEPKPAVTPTPETKPTATPELKMTISPSPETKATLSPSPEPKKPVTPDPKPTSPLPEAKPTDVKPIPSPTPEPPKALTPTPDVKPAISPDAKPAVSPTPEPTTAKVEQKPVVSPIPDSKSPDPKPLSPVPEPKPTSPTPQSKPPVSPIVDSKPTTNGTPESKADIGSEPSAPISPGLDVKDATPPKTADSGKSSVKTPELISSGDLDTASPPSSTDGAVTK